MVLRAFLFGLGVLAVAACKSQGNDSSTAAAGGQQTPANSEQCGTVMMKGTDIAFQVSGNNSENNVDYVLDPQDGATSNSLQDMAMKLSQACITADFRSANQPVIVKSISAIREVK